jgi:hypothetical protein
MLFDSTALRRFIDQGFPRTLGLATKTCGKIKVTTANDPSSMMHH